MLRWFALLFGITYINNVTSCSDNKWYARSCSYYKSLGHCRGYYQQSFMRRVCSRTCGFCRTAFTCVDKSNYCSFWENAGYCSPRSHYYLYMRVNCRPSCKFCRVIKPTTKTTTMETTTKELITTTKTVTKKEKINKDNCGKDKSPLLGQIIDGSNALKYRWIWQAGLYYFSGFVCGASIITPRHVLTAAHCVRWRDAEGLTVRVGDHVRDAVDGSEQEVDVEKVKFHQNYNGKTVDSDIAILSLKKPITINKNVGAVCVPEDKISPDMKKKTCYITGWGRMHHEGETVNILQEAKIPIVPTSECAKRNSDSLGNSQITENMLCAGFKNKKVSGCKGDSGGPLVCKSDAMKWILEGIVSWGSASCNATHRYTVFTRVRKFTDWIADNLN